MALENGPPSQCVRVQRGTGRELVVIGGKLFADLGISAKKMAGHAR